MTGRDRIKALFMGKLHETVEFNIFIAKNIRIGRAAAPVFGKEGFKDVIPVFFDEVDPQQRQTQLFSCRKSVIIISFLRADRIVDGRIAVEIVIGQGIPIAHESAGHVIALLF